MKNDLGHLTLFFCGDVMTGRGIDQALPHPGNPQLFESFVKNAKDYLRLAEEHSGHLGLPLAFDYIWGDALKEWEKRNPSLRVINLETSITINNDPWTDKEVHYRMNPANIPCLTAAKIDACALANNHVLDWGYKGLTETLTTLDSAGIKAFGAGENEAAAACPAIFELKNGRVLLFSVGSPDSGVPIGWKAEVNRPGVNFLKAYYTEAIQKIKAQVEAAKRPNDVVVLSIHWGSNWGYPVPSQHRAFAHRLIEEVGVDLVYGHSSHHFKGIEIHQGKLILYGCGDFFNDYEGIQGEEKYRGELTMMYFPTIDPASGQLIRLDLVPLKVKRFRLNHVDEEEASWMLETLKREGEKLGTGVGLNGEAAVNFCYPFH